MENIIFERDYTQKQDMEAPSLSAMNQRIFDMVNESKLLKDYADRVKTMPQTIIPEDKATYEDLLPRLDALARRMGGTIRGEVNYQDWLSEIIVIVPHLEINDDKDRKLISDIAAKTAYTSITPADDGNIKIYVMINYFTDNCSEEEKMKILGEELSKRPDLECLLKDYQQEQKRITLEAVNSTEIASEKVKRAYEAITGKPGENFWNDLKEEYLADPESFIETLKENGVATEGLAEIFNEQFK